MSKALATSELALITSALFIIILLPEIISKAEPAGTGAFLIKNTASPDAGSK